MPSLLARILVGLTLDAPTGLLMVRLAGVALLSLGAVCWFASRGIESSISFGVVAALVVYNVGAVVLLVSARCGSGMTGIGLIPAAALHAVLAAGCVACLRRGKWAYIVPAFLFPAISKRNQR